MEKEMENYYKSLSTAEWDTAEAVESELRTLLSVGFTELTTIKFVQTMTAIRKVMPDAKVSGVFETALQSGLSYVQARLVPGTVARSQRPTKQNRKAKLSGKGAK